jgi:hypothetical protein
MKKIFLAAFGLLDLALSKNEEKCTPASSCWPSEEEWQVFNATIDG